MIKQLSLYSIDTHLTYQQQTAFENIVGKGEIARYEEFLLFPKMFSTNSDNCFTICPHFWHHIFIYCWIETPKIGISDKGLNAAEIEYYSFEFGWLYWGLTPL